MNRFPGKLPTFQGFGRGLLGGDRVTGGGVCPSLAGVQKPYQALMRVIQFLQDLVHYGVGQVGDD